MAAVTIRNLSDDVVDALKARARSRGRSMEGEARAILSEAVGSESGLESAARERMPVRPQRRWITGQELMRAAEGMSPDSTTWSDEHRNRPYDDDPLDDPWERRRRAAP